MYNKTEHQNDKTDFMLYLHSPIWKCGTVLLDLLEEILNCLYQLKLT